MLLMLNREHFPRNAVALGVPESFLAAADTNSLLRNGTSKMASLDELTVEIAERFDLASKAPALDQEMGLISAQPGSMGGFLNTVKAAPSKTGQPHGQATPIPGRFWWWR